MLTLSNVRQFRAYLKDMELITDELLKVRERQRIFSNHDELEEARILQKRVPQDYYKFQLFEKYIELNLDKRGYYIYAENFVPYSDELRILAARDKNQYRINDDNFDNVVKVFGAFCLDMFHQVFKKENQLIYMY